MTSTTTLQHLFRIALGVMLCFAGTGHLTWAREAFVAQVPQWIPFSRDFIVVASGVVELLLGVSLIFWKRERVRIGWVTALFFILVFPGNIAQYVNHTDAFGLDTDTRRLVRLFFQPVLVIWAVWTTGAWQAWRRKNNN